MIFINFMKGLVIVVTRPFGSLVQVLGSYFPWSPVVFRRITEGKEGQLFTSFGSQRGWRMIFLIYGNRDYPATNYSHQSTASTLLPIFPAWFDSIWFDSRVCAHSNSSVTEVDWTWKENVTWFRPVSFSIPRFLLKHSYCPWKRFWKVIRR